jgi:hypothetical protein
MDAAIANSPLDGAWDDDDEWGANELETVAIVDTIEVPSSQLGGYVREFVRDRVNAKAATCNSRDGSIARVRSHEILSASVAPTDCTNRFVVRYICDRFKPVVGATVYGVVKRIYAHGPIASVNEHVNILCVGGDASGDEGPTATALTSFRCASCGKRFARGSCLGVRVALVDFNEGRFICCGEHACARRTL